MFQIAKLQNISNIQMFFLFFNKNLCSFVFYITSFFLFPQINLIYCANQFELQTKSI